MLQNACKKPDHQGIIYLIYDITSLYFEVASFELYI